MKPTNALQPLVPAVEQAHGFRPHLSTPWRWAVKGCRGIRLRTVVVGGRRLTTVDDVLAFSEATTAASKGCEMVDVPTAKQSSAQATRAAEQLAKRLAKF